MLLLLLLLLLLLDSRKGEETDAGLDRGRTGAKLLRNTPSSEAWTG